MSVKIYKILPLMVVVSGTAYGGVDADIFGSYENVLSAQYIDDLNVLDLNNLMVSVHGNLGQYSFLRADAEASLPFGAVQANLLDFLPDSLAETVPDSLRPMYAYRLEPSFRISNAYASLSWDRFTVRLGKQPLSWGTGYVWNPTEIIAPKLAYDPSYRRDGENAMKFAFAWRYGGGVEVMGILRGEIDSTMAVARLKENLFGFDVAAVSAWLWDTTITPGTSRNRILVGGQFAGEIGNIGLWAEGGYNIYEEDSLSYAEVAAGIDHTFTFRTHVMVEYLYYGRGFESADDYTFTGWLERAAGARKALGRHQIYLGADQTIISFHLVGMGAIINPVDLSGMVLPRISLNLADNLDLSLFGFISLGEDDTEFGAVNINGGILRLSGYF